MENEITFIECIASSLSNKEIYKIAKLKSEIERIRRKVLFSQKYSELDEEVAREFMIAISDNERFIGLIEKICDSMKYTSRVNPNITKYNAEWLVNSSRSSLGFDEIDVSEDGKKVYLTDWCRVYIEDNVPIAIFERDGKYKLHDLVKTDKKDEELNNEKTT